MNDLISRQALCEYALNQKDKSVTPNDIMRFPSAHSGYDEWCTDCKEYDQQKHSCPRWNRVIRQTVEDVRKERAGHWIHKLRHSKDEQFDYYEETCSVCGAEARFWWRNFKYCPMCGAKMEGIKDDGH